MDDKLYKKAAGLAVIALLIGVCALGVATEFTQVTTIPADNVTIVDNGGYYASDNAEGALQEIGENLDNLWENKLDSPLAVTTSDDLGPSGTNERALNTIYQNTTGKALYIKIRCQNYEDDMARGHLDVSPNSDMSGSITIDECYIGGGSYHNWESVGGHVPVNCYYRLTQTAGYWPIEILRWIEQTLG
jgi:hypothetical protein